MLVRIYNPELSNQRICNPRAERFLIGDCKSPFYFGPGLKIRTNGRLQVPFFIFDPELQTHANDFRKNIIAPKTLVIKML